MCTTRDSLALPHHLALSHGCLQNIMHFYAWWHDPEAQHINFITELFTAGSLRAYRKKV